MKIQHDTWILAVGASSSHSVEAHVKPLPGHCPRCGRILDRAAPVNLRIRGEKIGPPPLQYVSGGDRVVAHQSLLDSLDQEAVAEHLNIGRVFSDSGKEMAGWRSVFANRETVLRGTRLVDFRRCEACGAPWYYTEWPEYIVPVPDAATPAIMSHPFGLVIAPKARGSLLQFKWRSVKLLGLTPTNDPPDGFGIAFEKHHSFLH